MNKNISVLLIPMLILQSPVVFAGANQTGYGSSSTTSSATQPPPNYGASTTTNQQNAAATTATNSNTKTPTTGGAGNLGGLTNTGKDTKGSFDVGQLAAMGVGVYAGYQSYKYFGECSSQNYGACVIGALWAVGAVGSVMTAQGMNKGKGQSAQFQSNFDSKLYGEGGTANDADVLVQKKIDDANKQYDSVAEALRKKGVVLDAKKGTVTANGKTYSVKDAASAASMQAAGFSPSQISAFQDGMKSASAKALEDAKKALNTNILSGDSMGGGGGGATAGMDAMMDPSLAGANALAGGMGGANGRLPAAQVAGLKKNFNGEPIGIASDSIFMMMNRRYNFEAEKQHFLLGR